MMFKRKDTRPIRGKIIAIHVDDPISTDELKTMRDCVDRLIAQQARKQGTRGGRK